ncbi:hypothetical protein E4U59_003104 [Claviceps monticola]|nr:hypothetical protein E4U59_003104 [Claviceps monticola]
MSASLRRAGTRQQRQSSAARLKTRSRTHKDWGFQLRDSIGGAGGFNGVLKSSQDILELHARSRMMTPDGFDLCLCLWPERPSLNTCPLFTGMLFPTRRVGVAGQWTPL